MRTTTLLIACALLSVAAVVAVAPSAAATCYYTGDPVQDLRCGWGCWPDPATDPKELLEPRMCPA